MSTFRSLTPNNFNNPQGVKTGKNHISCITAGGICWDFGCNSVNNDYIQVVLGGLVGN